MTIYPARPPSFTCAICGDFEDYSADQHARLFRFRNAREYDIPPVCRSCEIHWGKGSGGWGDLNRDRRIARQISALADALTVEAHRAQRGEGPLNAKR